MIMFVLLQIERNLLMARPERSSGLRGEEEQQQTMELRNHEETRSSDGDGIEMKTATDIRRRRR